MDEGPLYKVGPVYLNTEGNVGVNERLIAEAGFELVRSRAVRQRDQDVAEMELAMVHAAVLEQRIEVLAVARVEDARGLDCERAMIEVATRAARRESGYDS